MADRFGPSSPTNYAAKLLSRAEAAERERDEANEKLSLVRSKTAFDVVAENMAAQRRAREAERDNRRLREAYNVAVEKWFAAAVALGSMKDSVDQLTGSERDQAIANLQARFAKALVEVQPDAAIRKGVWDELRSLAAPPEGATREEQT